MHTDPFGLAISDYFEGDTKAFIAVDSNITRNEKIKVSTLYRTYKNMPELERVALDCVAGKVLDIGAGSGAHALVLHQRGFDVTALDISAGACATMGRRGLHKVIHSDILNYHVQGYDTLLLLMNGIGIAGTLEGLDVLLSHLSTLLVKGGKIYLDTTDIMYMFVGPDGSAWIDLHGDYYGELQYTIRYKDATAAFPWLYLDFGTLETHAASAGFVCTEVLADEDGSYLACLEKRH